MMTEQNQGGAVDVSENNQALVATESSVENRKDAQRVDCPVPDNHLQVWRTLLINGRRTTVRLEMAYWNALDAMSDAMGVDTRTLIAKIDKEKPEKAALTPRLRLEVVEYYRRQVTELRSADS
ncbi:hypothetical protein CCP2SC5_730008 [Azospirillaceae bacterium]